MAGGSAEKAPRGDAIPLRKGGINESGGCGTVSTTLNFIDGGLSERSCWTAGEEQEKPPIFPTSGMRNVRLVH